MARALAGGRADDPRAIARDALLSLLLALPIFAFWRVVLQLGATAIDLYPTFVAGRLLASGHDSAVYHSVLWAHGDTLSPLWRAMMQAHHIGRADSTYVYGPAYLWLMLPLTTAWSWSYFKLFWLGLCALSAAFIGISCMTLAGRTPWQWRAAGALLAASSFGSYYGTALGQNVLPALALTLLGYRLYVRAGHVAGLAPLLLALLFKPWLVLFLPALLWLGRVRGCAVLAVSYAALQLGLPSLVSPALLQGYLGTLKRLSGASLVDYNNVSLRAFIHRNAWEEWPNYASAYAAMDLPASLYTIEYVALALVALLALGLTVKVRPSGDTVFCASLCLLLLPLGICWTHYLVLSLPACILLSFGDHPERARRSVGVLGLCMLLLPLPWVFASLPSVDLAHAALWSVLLLVPWLITLLLGNTVLTA